MANIVIFGAADTADLAHFYLKHDSDHRVVGFCVHSEYMGGRTTFNGLPLVAFEEVQDIFSPYGHMFFAPMSHRGMGYGRRQVYEAAAGLGYQFISYISSKATIWPRVWIGRNCFILEDNTLQPNVNIGNNVVMWSGNHIGHGSIIEHHVFFTSHVVLSGHCWAGPHSFFGVNSTIRNGVCIAEGTLVAMSACVTQDTEPWSVYMGIPAKKYGNSLEADLQGDRK